MFKGVAERGFTIVELIIVMAITGVLFIGIVSLVQTQNARSQFAQAINDVDSTINKYVTDTHSGVDVTAQQYDCTAAYAPARPSLGPPSGTHGIGANENCLFLGKALQVNPGMAVANSNKIFIYTVIGNRVKKDAYSNLVPITSFSEAQPEAGFVTQPSTTVTYNIPFGIKVKSSAYLLTPPTPQMSGNINGDGSNLVGFYNSLDSSGSGSQLTKAYDSDANTPNADPDARNCIEETTCPNTTYPTFYQWNLCLSDGSITATLSIIPTLAGVRSVIKYATC